MTILKTAARETRKAEALPEIEVSVGRTLGLDNLVFSRQTGFPSASIRTWS